MNVNLTPQFSIGQAALITEIQIRGSKLKFIYKDGKLSAEITNYGVWADLKWTHGKCLSHIEEHLYNKKDRPNFRWVYIVALGDNTFEVDFPLLPENLEQVGMDKSLALLVE